MTDFPLTGADTVIVADTGFQADDTAPKTATHNLGADADLAAEALPLTDLSLIRIAFPAFSDGRGFTLARRLRELGFTGHLRAVGHVLADQYAMARRSGFDDVEISTDLADRQPEGQWLARANWQAHDYRTALRA